MTTNWSDFCLYLRSCFNLRKRWWCHRRWAALRPKIYINIKVLFPGLMTEWVSLNNGFMKLYVYKSNDVSSSYLLALIILSSASVQMRWRHVWPEPNLINPHGEALPTVLSAIFTLLLLLQYNSAVLPFCCSVVPNAALLLCVVTIFCVQEMKIGTKTKASIIFEKHWDDSLGWEGSWLANYVFFSSTCMYIKI